MGTTQSAVSEIERLTANPNVAVLEAYARGLGLSIRYRVEPLRKEIADGAAVED